MQGELIYHYNDDEYRRHVPVELDFDEMTATVLDENDSWWEPESMTCDPQDSWLEVIDGSYGDSFSAVEEWDTDGIDHMRGEYGDDGFFVVRDAKESWR